MSAEAWIGLASLLVAIGAAWLTYRYRSRPSHQHEAVRDANRALNMLEDVMGKVKTGTPMAQDSPRRQEIESALKLLEDVQRSMPKLADKLGIVITLARLVDLNAASIASDQELRDAFDQWRRDDRPYSIYEPGKVFRRLAGGAIGQRLAAERCNEFIAVARAQISARRS
ncbi:hypothetical protein [Micromonospora taraxaci]|uniref:hypothetical protein n=1 Tax=Micromonospora taraxaci TaxID=1316803 RepID=UPI0033A6C6F1